MIRVPVLAFSGLFPLLLFAQTSRRATTPAPRPKPTTTIASQKPDAAAAAYKFEIIASTDKAIKSQMPKYFRYCDINDKGDVVFSTTLETPKQAFTMPDLQGLSVADMIRKKIRVTPPTVPNAVAIVSPDHFTQTGARIDDVTLNELGRPYINNNGSVAFAARYKRGECVLCWKTGIVLNNRLVVEDGSVDNQNVGLNAELALSEPNFTGPEQLIHLDNNDNVVLAGGKFILKNNHIVAELPAAIRAIGANHSGLVKYLIRVDKEHLKVCGIDGACETLQNREGLGTYPSRLFITADGTPVVGYVPLGMIRMNEHGIGLTIGIGRQLDLLHRNPGRQTPVIKDKFRELYRLVGADVSSQAPPTILDAAINDNGQIAFVLAYPKLTPNRSVYSSLEMGYAVIRATPAAMKAPPPCNGRFEKMLLETAQLQGLADALEKDDRLFANAVIEILLTGNRSPFAGVALDVTEADIPALFADVSGLAQTRAKMIATLRAKARFRESIAATGTLREPGRVPMTPGITNDVLDYFCSLDSQKMTKDSWTALWKAGYVDYDLYRTVQAEMWLRDAAQLIGEVSGVFSDAAMLVEAGFWSATKKEISIGAARLATYAAERGVLKAIGTRALPGALGATTVRARIVLGNLGELGRLGKFRDETGYVGLANKLKAARFDVPEPVWRSWTALQQEAANIRFLDWAMTQRLEIVLAQRVETIETVTGAFRIELEYLRSKGYKLSEDCLKMIK